MNHENRIREKLYTALLAITAALLVAFSGVLPGAGLSVSAIEHDTTLTVTGLDPGDRALFYQFVRWSDKGWCYTDAFTKSTASPPTLAGDSGILKNGITKDQAGTIASVILGAANYQASGNATADQAGAASLTVKTDSTGSALGIYCVIIEPANSDTIYNPVFVSLDFATADPNTNTFDVSIPEGQKLGGAYSGTDKVVAKKEKLSLVKTADKVSFASGDTITFTVDTVIPAYTSAYPENRRTFVITDELSVNDSLQYAIDRTAEAFHVTVGTTACTSADYDFECDGTTGWKISFHTAFLDDRTHWGQPVRVTYQVAVSENPSHRITRNIESFVNTVKIGFYNHPKTGEEKTLQDDTRHCTFGIGGSVEGGTRHHEIVKVEGNNESVSYTQPGSYTPLEGAVFEILTAEGRQVMRKDDAGKDVPYTCTTGKDGIFVFTGLDAGKNYIIREQSAPTGYVKRNGDITLKFDASFDSRKPTVVKNDVLRQYVVTVQNKTETVTGEQGSVSSSVTFLAGSSDAGSTLAPASSSKSDTQANVGNAPGTSLPSTGGIGTKIFHIVGIAVLLAVPVYLFFRRRRRIS
jgi:fimbrial isopeptide formation D2 family protein/LPXTG-motif cell wall-anchored protein